jgi:hypothetical protein
MHLILNFLIASLPIASIINKQILLYIIFVISIFLIFYIQNITLSNKKLKLSLCSVFVYLFFQAILSEYYKDNLMIFFIEFLCLLIFLSFYSNKFYVDNYFIAEKFILLSQLIYLFIFFKSYKINNIYILISSIYVIYFTRYNFLCAIIFVFQSIILLICMKYYYLASYIFSFFSIYLINKNLISIANVYKFTSCIILFFLVFLYYNLHIINADILIIETEMISTIAANPVIGSGFNTFNTNTNFYLTMRILFEFGLLGFLFATVFLRRLIEYIASHYYIKFFQVILFLLTI